MEDKENKVTYVDALVRYRCKPCGEKTAFFYGWIKDKVLEDSLPFGRNCPNCEVPMELPHARYWEENNELLRAYLSPPIPQGLQT